MDSSTDISTRMHPETFIYTGSAFDDAPKTPYHEVPICRATEDSVKKFGKLVPDFHAEQIEKMTWPKPSGWRKIMDDSGNKAAVAEGDYVIEWKGDLVHAFSVATDAKFVTARGVNDGPEGRKAIFVRDANYHPDGGQVFFSKSKRPFVMLMAPPVGDDIKLENFTAFWFDGSSGFNISPFVWHQAPYSVDDVMVFNNKQSSVFACVEMDTVMEFKKFLKVPLCL